ncbi:ANKRD50 [Symbiodinium sp. CCMP2456]|nr:ANKRD50 [Symbiodinium sp. CCMP2456]
MVRFTSLVLAAFAAALHVAVGFRSEHHPVWWHEHPTSSAEELQELLTTSLAASAATAEGRKEEPGDAEAQERTLRERVARVREDWQSTSANVCHQQLGRLVNNLTLTCEGLQPQADWLLDYLPDSYILPNKTCVESVGDMFALGNELVETLRVSRDAVASLKVDHKTLRRYQALSFLRSWLVNLTETRHHALLWAGFWDGDSENRTTMTKLSKFAKAIEHATVHPDSFLGQAIEASENLDACYKDPQTNALAANMWSIASMSFVLGMRERAQGTVIALVNKQITGERNLSESVLSTHEIPTVGLAAWGLGFWSPKVIVVDLMGTCDQTSPALQKRLLARLPSWAKSMTNWSPEAFAMRSRLRWRCIDCSGACSLDEALAEHMEKLVKAKAEQDLRDHELHEVTGCHLADPAENSLLTEVSLLEHLKHSLWKRRDALKMLEGLKWREDLLEDLQYRLSKAELVNQELETPERQLQVEQLLRRNADPKALDRLGHTALSCAAAVGHLELIQPLLDAGRIGATALTSAAEEGLALVTGAQLEARDEHGDTALLVAASYDQLKVVEALVEAGAQLDACNVDGRTALIAASSLGHLKVVEVLVKAGAQLEARDEFGFTALISAAQAGDLKVVEVLVKAGAQLEARDEHGGTALMFAANSGFQGVVEVLVKAGAQLETRDEHRQMALTVAAKEGYQGVVGVLVKGGAQLEARDEFGRTPLTCAAEAGHLKVVEVLVKAGAQLEARDERGGTALIRAAYNGQLEVVKALLKAGAQLEARNKYRHTALIVAAYRGYQEVVEVLVKAGAQLETGALRIALHEGHRKVVEVLVQAGAQLDDGNVDGEAALKP